MGRGVGGRKRGRGLLGPRAWAMAAAWFAFSYPRPGLAVTAVKPGGGLLLAMVSRLDFVEKGVGQDLAVPTGVNAGDGAIGEGPTPRLRVAEALDTSKIAGDPDTELLADAGGGLLAAAGDVSGGTPAGGGESRGAPVAKKKRRWGVPPVRLWGNLANYTSITKSENTPKTLQNTTQVSMSASSFVWQPWFAPVNGTLGFNFSRSKTEETVSNGTFLTGSAGISLLPQSRFPFDASIDVSDSRTSGDVVGTGYRATRIALRQSYRPLVGTSFYSASFDRSVLSSSDYGEDVQNALSGNMTHQVGNHDVAVDGVYVQNHVSQSGAKSETMSLVVRDNYRPSGSRWSLSNMVNGNKADSHVSAGDQSTRVEQLSSTVTWTPATEKPLYVTGNVRYFDASSEVAGDSTTTRSLSAYGGVNYEFARNARLSVAANYTTGSNLTLAGTTSVSYASDVIKLGKFDYSWSTGAGIGSQSGSDDSTLTRSASLGHGISRGFELGPSSFLNIRASQSANIAEGRTYSKTLTHSAGVSWSRTLEVGNLSLSLDGSDSRSFRGDPRGIQFINFQGTFNGPLSRYSQLSGSVTVQGSRSLTASGEQPGFDVATGGNISYSHRRFLNVRDLQFQSTLAANTQQFSDRFSGTIGALPQNTTSSWDNRLDYKLGLLTFMLNGRVARTDGRYAESVFFSVSRPFGDI
jgi:hypothetical protein